MLQGEAYFKIVPYSLLKSIPKRARLFDDRYRLQALYPCTRLIARQASYPELTFIFLDNEAVNTEAKGLRQDFTGGYCALNSLWCSINHR
jgi:hypothetical protein